MGMEEIRSEANGKVIRMKVKANGNNTVALYEILTQKDGVDAFAIESECITANVRFIFLKKSVGAKMVPHSCYLGLV
jgi:hypothetical protein